MNKDIKIIIELLSLMQQAIENGDWTVDGRCDPELSMIRATNYLLDKGIDWKKEDGEMALSA